MNVMFRKRIGETTIEGEIEGRIDHVMNVLAAFGHVEKKQENTAEGEGANELYRIVGKDNHASETVSDVLWMDDIADRELAKRICDKLNEGLGDNVGRHYTVLDPGEKMYKYEF